jgi:hypothetical protein
LTKEQQKRQRELTSLLRGAGPEVRDALLGGLGETDVPDTRLGVLVAKAFAYVEPGRLLHRNATSRGKERSNAGGQPAQLVISRFV